MHQEIFLLDPSALTRVKRISQTITDEVDAQGDQDNDYTWPPEQPRTRLECFVVLGNDLTQRDVGGGDPKSEEGQRGFGEDRRAHEERRVDHDDPNGVRQDVPENDAKIGRAGDTRRVDELTFTKGEKLTANQTSESSPGHEPEQDAQRNRVSTDGATQYRAEDEAGDDDDGVGDAHEQAVEPSANESCDRADNNSEHGCEHTDQRHDRE